MCAETGGLEYHPQILHHTHTDRILQWQRNKDYHLKAAVNDEALNQSLSFTCPEDYVGLSWAPTDIGDFNIISDGSLRGSNLPDYKESEDGSVKRTSIWRSDTYCMVISSPPDYSDYSEASGHVADEDLQLSFMHCVKMEEKSWEEIFRRRFHPAALIISIVFLFLTLLVYITDKVLRESVMGKITIGFLFNLASCFIVITDNIIKEGDSSYDRRGTLSCIISGYLIMYFFHSFFFWLNTLAFHIWTAYSSCKMKHASCTDKKMFLGYCLYSQVLPLLICCLTAGIDSAGKGKPNSELQFYPEMGVYSCFLGSQSTSAGISYFTSPVFIYHQSVLIISQLANLVMIILTWIHMVQVGGGLTQERKTNNFSLFIKLFFILGK